MPKGVKRPEFEAGELVAAADALRMRMWTLGLRDTRPDYSLRTLLLEMYFDKKPTDEVVLFHSHRIGFLFAEFLIDLMSTRMSDDPEVRLKAERFWEEEYAPLQERYDRLRNYSIGVDIGAFWKGLLSRPEPKTPKQTVPLKVRLTPDEFKSLKQKCADMDLTLVQAFRLALSEVDVKEMENMWDEHDAGRTKFLRLRVTEEEMARIEALTREAGFVRGKSLNVSGFVRATIAQTFMVPDWFRF